MSYGHRSLEYLKTLAEEETPPFWRNINLGLKPKILVDVDRVTKAAIERLVKDTWDPHLVGKGADAGGLTHSNLVVVQVQRIENPRLFTAYNDERKRLLNKLIIMGYTSARPIENIPKSSGEVATTEYLDEILKKDLFPEINEHYLLHGTKFFRIGSIITQGLDPKYTDSRAMFGKGVYTAEKSTKADQYADEPEKRRPHKWRNKLILSRMLLGNVFLCSENHKTLKDKDGPKLSGPPCIECLEDRCICRSTQPRFDSVMGDRSWRFREFVVYNKNQIYPEYVITYKRA
ncbi:poly [ADP-ribose] polymerase tankyrase-like [Physella acuta]|uniref:poly [ADP-ribose] polymerase tankyrase-like n=1 Tax=Physella acuta TaxID=109671 RepID=UPI0027DCA091|nr:poly [ADP-ribose] polymerase tankyrase-like [Physella acuta]